ncbi:MULTISPECIES: glycosyltransferase family 4 protein [unclassified Pseudofrankia]|uniref:glycosyltransferase family 4 protein n=1 Tax=unclassified Pseudofrankia TaxID=2994372 RepID=UPI0008DB0CE0|nr:MULTISPECIES: glycosyltransferase family 4 protein [unclassified Pseudofrankia]MDT3443984.1 glycosyltransferase family 4 protein [Pseudofrankia sp. BMG5.37]OHV44388.1 glycosyl transferase family 1 [Pseudofrankia sp. BMG5.36]
MYRPAVGAEAGADRPRVLLLAPSGGLGGGIERYLGTVEERLRVGGADVHRLDLRGPARPPGLRARLRFVVTALRTAVRVGPFDAVVTGHPNLIPVAAAAVPLARARHGPVFFYGIDIWGLRRRNRAILTRHPVLHPITISSYSAGTLADVGVAPVLRPGIATSWRETLLAAGSRRPVPGPVPTLLGVFRLNDADWEGKGLRELLAALHMVRERIGPVRLVVAGKGPALDEVHRVVDRHEDVELVESPDDVALAGLYAAADLFVLSTRTRPPRSGEGYGIVLVEAQLAGCPVVGPVSGGSRDAYLDGVTGATPTDESPEALAAVLADLLSDPARLARMRRQAAEWAQLATQPEEHIRAVFSAVLGTPLPTPRPPRPDIAPRSGQADPPAPLAVLAAGPPRSATPAPTTPAEPSAPQPARRGGSDILEQ